MQSTDEVKSPEVTQSPEATQSTENPPSIGPALPDQDEAALWEQKGRGLAVFRCPDEYAVPDIETRPGTVVLCDPEEGQDIPGEPDRLVLKLSSRYPAHMNSLLNRLVLPAYRRYIPLYLFTSLDLKELDAGSVGMPDKNEIEDAMCPLLREQLRSLLACTCAVFPSPESFASSAEPRLTPVENMMHEGLTRASLSHGLHVRLGTRFIDALVEEPRGNVVAVEIDAREFVRVEWNESDRNEWARNEWDRMLTESHNIRSVVRFSGSEVIYDLEGCVERIRSALAGSGPKNRLQVPEPSPGLAGEQARCLEPRAGVVLTLAPAGSGKTRVLTRRVVEAVRGGILPGRILCVVFNKAASEVMSERIHGDAGLPDVHIRTLHSLGYEICRQAPGSPYAGYGVVTGQSLPGGLTDLFRTVLKADFKRHLPAIPYPFPEHLVMAYEEAVSRYRRTLISIDGNDPGEEPEGFERRQARRICEEVERHMDEQSLMTFDEQLFRAVEILLANPRARKIYQHRFDSVLVDEVQDLTPVQFLMLRLLSLPLNNLFAVGDDDQMINTFTGADPENIRSFQRWYPGASVHTLGANYRCRPEIVTRSASVISHNGNRFEKPIRPVQTESGRNTIQIRKCPSLETETDAVVRTLRRWRKLGYAFADMAVLVRVQSIASPLQSALKEADLPFHPLDEGALYQSHVGRTAGAYFEVVARGEAANPLSYAISLSFPSRQLSNAQLRDAAALGSRFLERPAGLRGDAIEKLDEYGRSIETMRQIYRSPGVPPVEFLNSLMDHTGLADFYQRRDETSRQRMAASDAESIDMIRQMAARHPNTDSFVDAYLRSMDSETDADPEDHVRHDAPGEETIDADARSVDTAVDRALCEQDGGATSPPEDRITVTTIHRSKGDEFKGVILFHVVEDILPHRRMQGSEEQIEEERRVFYVALTRAEERLCITTQRNRPSRFLAEMEPAGRAVWLKRVLERLTFRSSKR